MGTTPANPKRSGVTGPYSEEVKLEAFGPRNLRVQLTPEEKAKRAERVTEIISLRDRLDEQAKAAAKEARGTIAKLDAELRSVASELRTGATYRDVPCQRQFHYSSFVVREIRLDTGETIAERAMTESERQLDFFDEEPETETDSGVVSTPPPSNDLSELDPPLETEKPKRGRPKKVRP